MCISMCVRTRIVVVVVVVIVVLVVAVVVERVTPKWESVLKLHLIAAE